MTPDSRSRSSVFYVAVILAATVQAICAAVPVNFQNETIISELAEPTGVAFTPDGRMLILQRDGRIRVVAEGGTEVGPAPFLQITNINTVSGERGLVGIALDPGFATNGFYYVFYTSNSPLRDRVSRFTASGDSTVAGSEVVIWQDNETASEYHHGGKIAFGPDGNLYVSVGDHATPWTVQSLTSYAGKILRIRPDGTIPTDNPFYDGAGPNLDEIWARGLRNPFRFTFDSETGTMYIGDNGDNDPATSIEEVNVGAAGANYGWPICQGSCGDAGMTNPIHSYPHAGQDASIIGGFVYRGTQFPAEYQGSYFYADYVGNWIRRLTFDANGNVIASVPFEPEDGSSNGPYGDIVDMASGPDGSLYYVDIGLSWEGEYRLGSVRRISYVFGDQPPVAVASGNPTQGSAPLAVDFSSAGSSDPEGQPLTFAWTFGDGGVSDAPNPSHSYTSNGRYNARVGVSDGSSTTFSNTVVISVGDPPVATISAPEDGSTFRAGDVIAFSGSGTDPDDGALPASAFTWNVQFLHDNHTHPFLGPLTNATGGEFEIETTGHDFRGFTRYLITLTVTDSDGLQDTASVTVFPEKVLLSFDTVPGGLGLNFDGIAQSTPFVWDTLVGFEHTVEAPNQSLGGTSYEFSAWSDAGAQLHSISAPANNTSYTATYQGTAQPSGQMLAYSFSEGSGGTTADLSGNDRTGTLVDAAWTPSGRYGNAVSFNGTSSRVAGPTFTLPQTFTILAWIHNPSNQLYETVVSVGQNRDLYLENGQVVFEGGGTLRRFGQAIPNGAWHHVAVVATETETLAYLDGEPLGTSAAGVADEFTGVLQVGSFNWFGTWGDFFSGTLDEVRIYDRALTIPEVQMEMNAAGGVPAPVPVISGLVPGATTAAGPAFALTVNGTGFTAASRVRWNGSDRATTFVSGNQLTASIAALDIATAGAATVTVYTPAPGGGTSNGRTFDIDPNPDAQTLRNGFGIADSNDDQGLSYSEALSLVPGLTLAQFNRLDADGDGSVSMSELMAASVGAPGVASTVYVDFAYGGAEDGTESAPFNTLYEAAAFVAEGGALIVAPGQSTELLTMTKGMQVQSPNGLARVGAP